MARIGIQDLPRDEQFGELEMRAIRGGVFGSLPALGASPSAPMGGGGAFPQRSTQSMGLMGLMQQQADSRQYNWLSSALRGQHSAAMATIRRMP